jgi:hypothetical protein
MCIRSGRPIINDFERLARCEILPRILRIFFSGVLALGPPATLNGVNEDRLPERWILVHRPSFPSRDQESTCRSSAFCFSVLGILHDSKCSLFNSATGDSELSANMGSKVRFDIPVSDSHVIGLAPSTFFLQRRSMFSRSSASSARCLLGQCQSADSIGRDTYQCVPDQHSWSSCPTGFEVQAPFSKATISLLAALGSIAHLVQHV